MNNSITATVFIALMLTMGITTAFVFAPSPAVIFKTTEGESLDTGLLKNVGGGRGR